MDYSTFLVQEYFGNTIENYLIALLIVVGAALLAKFFKIILETRLAKWAKSTTNTVDDLIIEVVLRPIVPLITLIGLYFAIGYLVFSPNVDKWAKVILQVLIALKVTSSLLHVLYLFVDSYFNRNVNLKSNANFRYLTKKVVSIVVWVLVFILIITNLGYNLNSLLAGLGIGGIAIALAVQNVLGDLFGSVSIFVDRPFQIGDFIVVGDKKGTVKAIGMKTTRLNTLQGEELVLPNAMLTSKEIQNFRKMKKRRIVFQIGVTYETSVAKIKKIPEMIGKIISSKETCTLNRIHFATFGDFSLNFEIVYFVSTGDYAKYMDTQQAINLEIMEAFEKEKIEFAYPTQKVFVAK